LIALPIRTWAIFLPFDLLFFFFFFQQSLSPFLTAEFQLRFDLIAINNHPLLSSFLPVICLKFPFFSFQYQFSAFIIPFVVIHSSYKLIVVEGFHCLQVSFQFLNFHLFFFLFSFFFFLFSFFFFLFFLSFFMRNFIQLRIRVNDYRSGKKDDFKEEEAICRKKDEVFIFMSCSSLNSLLYFFNFLGFAQMLSRE
jgi:hypothetical protein